VNNSVLGGGDLTGALWNRTQDRLGVAVVSNGLSSPHREYYTAHVWRGLSVSGGLQHIDHPGYNRDRGPILVEMMRLHIDL
jgi:hypothetical protein